MTRFEESIALLAEGLMMPHIRDDAKKRRKVLDAIEACAQMEAEVRDERERHKRLLLDEASVMR